MKRVKIIADIPKWDSLSIASLIGREYDVIIDWRDDAHNPENSVTVDEPQYPFNGKIILRDGEFEEVVC